VPGDKNEPPAEPGPLPPPIPPPVPPPAKPPTKAQRAAAHLAWAAAHRRNRNGENTADRPIRPLDVLMIQCTGTMPDQPINSMYLVEPSGQVSFGLYYGRVDLKGQTLEQAETAVQKHLAITLAHPVVQLSPFGHATRWRPAEPKTPYRIAPNDRLKISAIGTIPYQPIDGEFVVGSDGKVPLGWAYGDVKLKGLTLEGAEKAIVEKLRETLTHPEVAVTLSGWETDRYLPVGPSSPGEKGKDHDESGGSGKGKGGQKMQVWKSGDQIYEHDESRPQNVWRWEDGAWVYAGTLEWSPSGKTWAIRAPGKKLIWVGETPVVYDEGESPTVIVGSAPLVGANSGRSVGGPSPGEGPGTPGGSSPGESPGTPTGSPGGSNSAGSSGGSSVGEGPGSPGESTPGEGVQSPGRRSENGNREPPHEPSREREPAREPHHKRPK
jgi:protein involved in polysaccharide export with SLBB domain